MEEEVEICVTNHLCLLFAFTALQCEYALEHTWPLHKWNFYADKKVTVKRNKSKRKYDAAVEMS